MKKVIKCNKNTSQLSRDVDKYQEWIDFDMKRYGKISDITMQKIKKAGFTVTKDQYGDYEVTASCRVNADTVKKGDKWINRGDTGKEHGEFDTKKEADAQRRAMYANGYKSAVKGSDSDFGRSVDMKKVIRFRKEPKSIKCAIPINCSGTYDEEVPIHQCIPEGFEEFSNLSEDELIETVEDSGYMYCGSIAKCCEVLFDTYDGDVVDCLGQIDTDWGNAVGLLPLAYNRDYDEQQEIFLDWVDQAHPEINVAEIREEYGF